MQELDEWLTGLTVAGFPYEAIVEEFHRVGKHFVSADLMEALDRVRTTVRVLESFLDTALDKWDERYDYQTYLSLGVLPLPGASRDIDTETAARQRDRLVVQLIADTLRFELDVADGNTHRFPEQRPDAKTVSKRYRLGIRAVQPLLDRLGAAKHITADDPEEAARQLCAFVEADRSAAEQQMLTLSNLPVYVSHDEYMFIRVLQSFETTFALLSVCLRSAVAAISAGDPASAVGCLQSARTALDEAARLFSLLATTQVASFQRFRMYTEGASAIQSRNYKTIESLCRVPDQSRLDSAAYLSVPEVRDRVLAGQATLDEVIQDAAAGGKLDPAARAELETAMHAFAKTLLQWRQTHYSLAVRMLGNRSGTGYTEGTPYLDSVRKIPVFPGIEAKDGKGEPS
ncbi:tryptophan 2,3-dioxygenase [Kibdelosporangium banguiense]|uniref:Tryptophan 2,3-dioxygenase n=1 Tax=Kibdelosporangium banguiense TaxID=1365924 RepID=A0ABS4TPT6_9PSEU|nr:hypothetical protein [Kibdelosporangium banguiense]MBP2326415.1 tryptophan 2,3-dioxygenase [Kibdelosporangium banguiense]